MDDRRIVLRPETASEVAVHANTAITGFLEEHVVVYRELLELRRRSRPTSTPLREQLNMFASPEEQSQAGISLEEHNRVLVAMRQLALQMQLATRALKIKDSVSSNPCILDLCAAPGAFVEIAMNYNSGPRVRAFSLPLDNGGWEWMLLSHRHITIEMLDITTLAEDMGVTETSHAYAVADSFQCRRLDPTWDYDLIVCNGQLMCRPQHQQPSSSFTTPLIRTTSSKNEAECLLVTQLVLGLRHVKEGGTMIIYLRCLDNWDTVATLYRLSRFSKIELFKSNTFEPHDDAFFVIATKIRPKHPAAVEARRLWFSIWEAYTLAARGGTTATNDRVNRAAVTTPIPIAHGLEVKAVLKQFGPKLVKIGRDVWMTQARALSQARLDMQQSGRKQQSSLGRHL